MSVQTSDAPATRGTTRGAPDTSRGLDIVVRHVEGVDVVELRGELDAFSAPRLRGVLADASVCGAPGLVVDLSQVSFLDSAGLSTIVAGRRLCAARGGRTVLVAEPGSATSRLLELMRVPTVIDLVADRATALAAVRPGAGA